MENSDQGYSESLIKIKTYSRCVLTRKQYDNSIKKKKVVHTVVPVQWCIIFFVCFFEFRLNRFFLTSLWDKRREYLLPEQEWILRWALPLRFLGNKSNKCKSRIMPKVFVFHAASLKVKTKTTISNIVNVCSYFVFSRKSISSHSPVHLRQHDLFTFRLK